MKRVILCAGLFIGAINMVEAQTKSTATKKTSTKKTEAKQSTQRLESSSSHEAKAPAIPRSSLGWQNTPAAENGYQITDPILRTLNARANGANSTIEFKELVGVGRGTYGVANGRILLRPTGSTTPGGITGTGSVATGSSPGGPGIHGTVPTVNGKNPYAGPSMWGTTGTGIGSDFRQNEISIRTLPLKRQD
ncbi:MAG TPA: hypothetical protein VD794_09590 [Flavisolibacter sp.]|nr:hypothetical protein [Flavisolibacter sp.]